MPRRYDDQGFVIVRDNSDRCRDCGGDKQNIAYRTMNESYCQCVDCDPERGLYTRLAAALTEEDMGTTPSPDLYTVDVTLYGPHDSGEGFVHVATGTFDIDLHEELVRSGAVDLLGRFIVDMRAKYEWQNYDRNDMIAGAEFPGLGMVYANGLGEEVQPEQS